MLVYLTEEEVRRLKAAKFLVERPDHLLDWFKIYEPEPLRELAPQEIDQAKTELNCSDEELAGMEA